MLIGHLNNNDLIEKQKMLAKVNSMEKSKGISGRGRNESQIVLVIYPCVWRVVSACFLLFRLTGLAGANYSLSLACCLFLEMLSVLVNVSLSQGCVCTNSVIDRRPSLNHLCSDFLRPRPFVTAY